MGLMCSGGRLLWPPAAPRPIVTPVSHHVNIVYLTG